ncbi:hypothetical protein AB0C18_05265 [Nonomuraea muscovyensis]|uniref:hypothetical protein n=1 Tax=Nonomuraea muscovyensis TaxID=1124761 RepID=UPI0033E65BA6
MPIALSASTIGVFGIGLTEFIIAGLMPDISQDLGVSIPTADPLVSGYAEIASMREPRGWSQAFIR